MNKRRKRSFVLLNLNRFKLLILQFYDHMRFVISKNIIFHLMDALKKSNNGISYYY